jgi:hypothetical protein
MQIEFNGQAYKLETLVSLIGFGRQEKMSVQDVVIVKGSACKSKLPVCHVYVGKVYLLAGEIDTSKDKVDVCILTKHVLKKALMSVQSQPIDTYVSPAKSVLVSENQKINKAIAALAKLNPTEEVHVPRARNAPETVSRATVNDQARKALRILEATITRKNEVEKSDWK